MWKDITSYSQDDKDRNPKTWCASSPPLKVIVTCSHRDYAPGWVMHCYAVGIHTLPLDGCLSVDDAKKTAIEIVHKRIMIFSASAKSLSA